LEGKLQRGVESGSRPTKGKEFRKVMTKKQMKELKKGGGMIVFGSSEYRAFRGRTGMEARRHHERLFLRTRPTPSCSCRIGVRDSGDFLLVGDGK